MVVQIIFPVILQTDINVIMLSIGRTGGSHMLNDIFASILYCTKLLTDSQKLRS